MPAKCSRTFCFMALLCTLLMLIFIKGCNENKSGLPSDSQPAGLALKIFANPETQAKLTGLTIDVVGLNDPGQPAVQIPSIRVSDVNLPVTVPLTLYDPPCRYQVTVTANLTREAPRSASRVLDICHESRLTLQIDTFEGFWLAGNPLHAPASVNAGAAADVACSANEIDAPDKGQYPLTATLREQDGQNVSGPFDVNVAVAASFPDPYPLSSQTDQRRFTCEIADGHSTPQTFTLDVKRIPATPTPTPTAMPTAAPPANPTLPPTHSCVVTTANDSGAGSLRQLLTDVACPTITFAPGVTTITLAGTQLTVARNVTINGGSGVTISGNNASCVFVVYYSVTAAFAGLTITNGFHDDECGGGIENGGTLTLERSTTVTGNRTTLGGGGICNLPDGTLTVNGIVSGNTVNNNNENGGGIYNDGTLYLNGTVSGNTAAWEGGGIYNNGTATINGTISGNTGTHCGGIGNLGGTVILNGTVKGNMVSGGGGGICNSTTAILTLNAGHVIEGNHSDSDNSGGETGGGIDTQNGVCPTNANYGTGNYRGSGTTTIDNCNGNP